MSLVESQSVKANRCTCRNSDKFVVNGNPSCYTQPHGKNELILPAGSAHSYRPTIDRSILVFCHCGNLTIHYYPDHQKWHSRRMWRGWRKQIKLEWSRRLENDPFKNDPSRRTLANVHCLQLFDSLLYFWRLLMPKMHFINAPNDNHDIDDSQFDIAEEIFSALLNYKTYHWFRVKFTARIWTLADRGAMKAYELLKQKQLLAEMLPLIRQGIFNLKDRSKSSRMRNIQALLKIMCKKAEILLPELLNSDSDTDKTITQLIKTEEAVA